MDYYREIEEKKQLAARLRSADPSVTLDIFENYVPHNLACLLVEKVFAVSADDKDDLQPDEAPQKPVPSLVDLCAALVGSDKGVVDTLFTIYGPDANFPFPSWVEPKVRELSKVNDLVSKFKLALLLSNNATTTFSFFSDYEDEETEVSKVLGPLVWKKLSRFCKKLKVVKARCSRDDEDYPEFCNPIFYQKDIVLFAVLQLSDLCVLEVTQTAFLDADLEMLGTSLPQLKTLAFKFDGRVSKQGVQALGQLKKLEELLFDSGDDDLMKVEDYNQIIDTFISRCLGTLPWLKVLCSTVEDDAVFEHMMPLMEEGQVLSLEHLQLREFLSVNVDDYEDDSELMYPYLRNVRILKFQGLDNDEDMIENLVDKELVKVEKLIIEHGCECRPVRLLLEGIGKTLTKIEINDCKGAWNFLRILEGVPVAMNVCITSSTSRKEAFYSFDDHPRLHHVSPHLKKLFLNLDNKDDCELPRGVLTRLLELPKLEDLTLNDLLIPAEECNEVALRIQSGDLPLQNFSSFSYRCGGDDSTLLLAVLCVYCPNFKGMDLLYPSGLFKSLFFVLSALLYPRIKLKNYL